MATLKSRHDGDAIAFDSLSKFLFNLNERLDSIEQKLQEVQSGPDMHTPIGVNEASAYLHLSRSRVYMLSLEGKIPCHRRGGRLYFFRSELAELIRSGKKSERKSRNKKAVAL